MTGLNTLEQPASAFLDNGGRVAADAINDDIRKTAKALREAVQELRDLLPSLRVGQSDDSQADEESGPNDDMDDDVNMDSMRRRLQDENDGTLLQGIKSAAGGILPMLDPPLHESVFGMDVLRGTVLARYCGAAQLWIDRPRNSGRIDVMHFPAVGWNSATHGRNTQKAVLYCNPNAGLIEVATGISVVGGNVAPDETPPDVCWTDFYTQLGYDVYLFNYAGFGRSHGAPPKTKTRSPGVMAALYRIFNGCFLSFKVTTHTQEREREFIPMFLV